MCFEQVLHMISKFMRTMIVSTAQTKVWLNKLNLTGEWDKIALFQTVA